MAPGRLSNSDAHEVYDFGVLIKIEKRFSGCSRRHYQLARCTKQTTRCCKPTKLLIVKQTIPILISFLKVSVKSLRAEH